jgi:hypothetical protein
VLHFCLGQTVGDCCSGAVHGSCVCVCCLFALARLMATAVVEPYMGPAPPVGDGTEEVLPPGMYIGGGGEGELTLANTTCTPQHDLNATQLARTLAQHNSHRTTRLSQYTTYNLHNTQLTQLTQYRRAPLHCRVINCRPGCGIVTYYKSGAANTF